MRRLVGLIPAAGTGSRLGAPGSKEVVSVADPERPAGCRQPVISLLLDRMAAAGIDTAYLVLRVAKWDVMERLAERADQPPRLAYVLTGPTRSIPESLGRARPFVAGHDVLLGFPDVVFQPGGAVRELRQAWTGGRADVILGLFPSGRPDKTDMVELDGHRVTGFRIKPGPSELDYTWLLAAWGDRFTEFLDSYLERAGGGPPSGSPLPELQISQVMAAALVGGLTITARIFPQGRFLDVGTPDDLARAAHPER